MHPDLFDFLLRQVAQRGTDLLVGEQVVPDPEGPVLYSRGGLAKSFLTVAALSAAPETRSDPRGLRMTLRRTKARTQARLRKLTLGMDNMGGF